MVKKKRPTDINQLAAQIVAEATQEQPVDNILPQKNPAAVALGHLGGLKGGPARAKKLSSKKRKQIAQKAAKVRWRKKSE
jgi:methenyltetrahydromethanopterin cyclohydrolase